jgi:hypothetical protein
MGPAQAAECQTLGSSHSHRGQVHGPRAPNPEAAQRMAAGRCAASTAIVRIGILKALPGLNKAAG